uniref:C2H2-type domain-containing protein n=1 Tax=Panagrolaimus sp. ES5 TaxID=591445 RepID=A0AC34GWV0_9BILA
MLFFVCLLLLFQLSECSNDYGKGSKLSNEQISALPIPDLAPYDSTNDPLPALNATQKIYIQSLFSKSVYYKKCDKPPKPIIKPIYFWPGKRIDLPCRMCLRSFVYNGLIKHWSVLRHGISDEISNIISKKGINNDNWEIIDQEYSDNFVNYSQKTLPLMPQRKNGNDSKAIPKEAYRPRTQFFQRDGKLIILHPHMDSYGLYRCFDKESSKVVNFVYFLIPITPIFTMLSWNVHLHQCPKTTKTEFRYLDEFHQFHFLPAILPKQKDICPTFVTSSSPQDYCSVDTFNEISQPPLNNIINVSLFEHEGDQEFMAQKINLKIFISWSKWSSCNGREALKTRYGFCHIGKRDPSKKLQKGFEHAKTLMNLHKFLDNVEEFKVNGIRLFSGILADIINSYGHNATHCNDYSNKYPLWDEIQKSMINLVKGVTKDTISEIRAKVPDSNDLHFIESVCLRNINKFIKGGVFKPSKNVSIEYGQKIIQNEPC